MEPYLNDKSNLIKEAAVMLCDYDKSERAQMERDARNKQELEYYTRINAATKEGREKGLAQGIAQGREEGSKQTQKEMISLMHESGMSKEDIARVLKMDLSKVEEILK